MVQQNIMVLNEVNCMESGKTKIYIGNGTEKTTSAIGQGIKAIGAGKKVHMVQFFATQCFNELTIIKRLEPDFSIFCFEKQKGPYRSLTDIQKEELKNDLQNSYNFAKKILETKQCDLLILDEILTAMTYNLISQESVAQLIKQKPPVMDLILTGQFIVPFLSSLADDIIEIRSLRQPKDPDVV